MKAIIYARKSTDRADRQQLSVENQISEAKKIAEREGLEIVEIIHENKSAKDPGRPEFNRMMSLINKGKANSIITWKLNRLARNPIDEGTIKWALQNGTIQTIYTQGENFHTGDNVLIMGMHFGMSTQYILELKADSARGVKQKMAKGGVCQPAPFGYINNRVEKSIEVDIHNAKWVVEMFEMRASKMSYVHIEEVLYEKGLRNKVGKKMSYSTIETMLKNKFYIGMPKRFGEYYKGNYEPLVSVELFEKAQNAGKGQYYRGDTPREYHFKGLLKDKSGTLLSGYKTKGNIYYKTSFRSPYTINLSQNNLLQLCDELMQSVEMNKGFLELNKMIITDLLKSRKPQNEETLKSLNHKIQKLKNRETELLNLRLDGELDKKVYLEKKNEITLQIQHIESEKNALQNTDFERRRKAMFELAESPYQRYKSKNIKGKSVLLQTIMFELFIKKEKELSYAENSVYSCLKTLQKVDLSNLEVPPGVEPGYRALQAPA